MAVVRRAKASDLAATSHIAFRSFSLSPWNRFYRPFSAPFPQDVRNSYLREQQEALGNRKKLFTVVETEPGAGGARQVVGFAIWNFAPQQQRESEPIIVKLTNDQDRSVDPYRANLLFGATERAVEEYLEGHMELDNMAVDPAHFRKGYGALLCRHGMGIAEEDMVPVGVVAAALGMKLYEALGFSCSVKIEVTDGRQDKEASVDFWIQKWDATST